MSNGRAEVFKVFLSKIQPVSPLAREALTPSSKEKETSRNVLPVDHRDRQTALQQQHHAGRLIVFAIVFGVVYGLMEVSKMVGTKRQTMASPVAGDGPSPSSKEVESYRHKLLEARLDQLTALQQQHSRSRGLIICAIVLGVALSVLGFTWIAFRDWHGYNRHINQEMIGVAVLSCSALLAAYYFAQIYMRRAEADSKADQITREVTALRTWTSGLPHD